MDLETQLRLLQTFCKKKASKIENMLSFYLNLQEKEANSYSYQCTLLGMKDVNILEESNAQKMDSEPRNNATIVISPKEFFAYFNVCES